MEEVFVQLDPDNRGKFYLKDGETEVGHMEIGIVGNTLTVFHTEVSPAYEGKGLAKIILNGMVSYARKNNLKVRPLCPYVLAQFKRHAETYADVWQK